MPRRDIPKTLEPYAAHGLEINYRKGDAEVTTECPFCSREEKFSIAVDSGLSRCLVCAVGSSKGGLNSRTFLRELWKVSYEATDTSDYASLASERGLRVETLLRWEVCRSITNGRWLIPGYGADGALNQLYRYFPGADFKLPPTPSPNKELGHHLHGVNLYEQGRDHVYLAEGPWDGMALWETLAIAKLAGDGGLQFTGNESGSLLSQGNVLACPGVNVFKSSWLPLFKGKKVWLLFDNDYPRRHKQTNEMMEPAALVGMRRFVTELSPVAESVGYLYWGDNGYSYDYPKGTDVRDILCLGVDKQPGIGRETAVV